jgi:hypothetical protein
MQRETCKEVCSRTYEKRKILTERSDMYFGPIGYQDNSADYCTKICCFRVVCFEITFIGF